MGFILRKENLFLKVSLLFIFSLGLYFCFIGGYGSDEDTLPMIYSFESKLYDGRFVSSRFTGNPVAEIGIGFLSVFFGSFLANLFTYLFLLFGLFFFYLSFNKTQSHNQIYLFLLICLTNPILFFDNLEPIDYSWAFFFFSIGVFFFKKKIIEFAILCFALSIGARINYVLFILAVILFFETDEKISYKKRASIFFTAFIFGGMFYLPIWFENKFDLSWLTAARPIEQGFIGLMSRFLFKTYISIGYLSSFVIIFYLLSSLKNFKKIDNIKVLAILCVFNLLIFFWIPAEYSYLQLFLVIILFLIYSLKNKKIIYGICLLNLISWFIFINPISVKYKEDGKCAPKHAISANINFKVEDGFFYKYIESRDDIKCWVYGTSERYQKILEGKALKRN